MLKNFFFQKPPSGVLKKLIIMKVMTLFLMVVFLQASAGTYSQNMTISLKNVTIQKVFKEIQKQSDYLFFYNEKLMKYAKKITIDVKNGSIQTILQLCFKDQPFTYAIDDKQIIIKAREVVELKARDPGIPLPLPDITGKITDSDGAPLAGATIKLKGSAISTVADQSGRFTLSSTTSNGILEISFVGYETREISFSGGKAVAVTLNRKENKVDEVVVIGYGTQKKINVTGAVNTIKGDEIQQSSSVNVANALAGRSPGVISTSYSGDPGNDNPAILIRGINSFGGGTAPLIVVDGVPDRDFSRLNPIDIESITILKDASAAIYGVRSANGVILVTTKRGTGKSNVTYDLTYGLQQYTRLRPSLTNSLELFTYANEANVNEGKPEVYTQAFIDANKGVNTNWFREALNDFAPQVQHKLTFSGSTEKVNYYISGQYLDQRSNFKVTDKRYKQFNILSNIDAKVSKYIKLSLDFNARRQDNNNPADNTSDPNYPFELVPYKLMQNIDLAPTWYPVKWSNGLYALGIAQGSVNPVIKTSNLTGYNNSVSLIINTKMGADIQLPFVLKGLSASGYYSYDVLQTNNKAWVTPYNAYDYNPTSGAYVNVIGSTGAAKLDQRNSLSIRKTLFAKIAYDRKFGNQTINSFVGYEESATNGEILQAYRSGFISTSLDQLFAGGAANQVGIGNAIQDGRRSYLGRLGYNYSNKYLAEITMRYNGSFNFAPNKRWGLFPAASVGWRISEENFFRNNVKFINSLKLRASWGLMGSDAVTPYQYIQTYAIVPSNYYDNFLYTGTNYQQNFQIGRGPTPNPNITWEKQDSKNIGLDLSLLSSRLTATIDFFKYIRRDILAQRNGSIPIYTGLSLPSENIGKMQNQGFDLSINYSERRTAIQYYVGLNFGYTTNKIIFRDESPKIPDWQKSTGYSADSYTIYKTNGIYHNQADIDKSPHLDKAAPGDIWIKDVSGDGNIDVNDMVRINNSPTARMTFGIPMGIVYKGISIDLLWAGQSKAKILIQPMAGLSGAVPPKWLFDGRWTPQNPTAIYPRAFNGLSNRNQIPSDLFLIDGSFLRLKSAEIAYTVPTRLYTKLGITNLSVRLSGFNLFSFDYFKKFGRDVENTSIPGTFGAGNNSSYQYPQTRIYQIGLRVSF